MFVVAFIAIAWSLSRMLYGGPLLPWGAMAVASLVLGILGLVIVTFMAQGYTECRDAYRDMMDARDKCRLTIQRHEEFLAAFPVAGTHVASYLQSAAVEVWTAHQNKVAFYQNERGHLGEPQIGDPEAAASALRVQFAERERELEAKVQEAIAEFRRKRDLAEWQGQQVRKSWKDYAPVTSLGHPFGQQEIK